MDTDKWLLTMWKHTWVFISDAVFGTFNPLSMWLTPTETDPECHFSKLCSYCYGYRKTKQQPSQCCCLPDHWEFKISKGPSWTYWLHLSTWINVWWILPLHLRNTKHSNGMLYIKKLILFNARCIKLSRSGTIKHWKWYKRFYYGFTVFLIKIMQPRGA